MRYRNLFSLLALNVCLLGAQAVFTPARADISDLNELSEPGDPGDPANPTPAGHDCCKSSQSHIRFCCDQCCTAEDCDSDADCQKSTATTN
jgi:hypothetical protein